MTTTTEITDPFDQAVAEAMDELGEASPDESLPAKPAGEIEVLAELEPDPAAGEQSAELEPPGKAEDGEDAPEELFADLEVEETEKPQASPTPDLHELPGIDEPVTTEELRNGYLRQSNYTKKTQELAVQRQDNQKAIDFWEALTARPQDVVRQLAESAGLIEPGAQPVKVVDLPFRPEVEIQAEVDQKVAAALETHPDIQRAQDILAERWIETEFARIETTHEVKLGPKSREVILKTAAAKSVDDLEMVYQALKAKQDEKARQRESLKGAAPAKPTGKATPQAVTEDPQDFWEAAQQAAAEKGIQLNLT